MLSDLRAGNSGKLNRVISLALLLGIAGSWGASSMAQQGSYDYQRVYTGSAQSSGYPPNYYGYTTTPAYNTCNYCSPQQPVYKPQRRVASVHRAKAAYQAPPRKTLGAKIEDGFHDAFHSRIVKKGILGAATGLGLAALTERNLLRGSLIGLGVGVGVGTMDDSYYFKRHPWVRRTSKGALIGVGAAAATGAAALWPAAALGAGVGTGIHYIKTH